MGEEGLEQIQQGLTAHRATGAKVDRPEFLCWLAKGYCAIGRLGDALDTINDALKVSENHEYLLLLAEMYRLKGDFLLRKDDFSSAEARACFERGIKVAQKQDAKSLELSAATSLARLLAKQDRPQEARAVLTEIYSWFTEGFDTADLKEAKVLLDSLND